MIVQLDDIQLFYSLSGNGSPLLLLHGNGEDHHVFDALASKLKDQYTVYAIDSRNHGESTKTSNYSYQRMSQDVYNFIKVLELEQVSIVGFSDGAIVSLMLAMQHQEVLSKMVLLGVNLKPSDFTEENYQYIKDTYTETNDPLFQLMLEQPNIELSEVHPIQTPTLVVAAQDDLFRPEMFEELTNALPHAKLLRMLGHTASTEYIDFSGGKLAVVAFKLDDHSPLLDHTLAEVTDDRDHLHYRTIAITRGGESIIPKGNDVFKEDDMIYVICEKDHTKALMQLMGKTDINIDNMMILGGSRIGRRVAMELQDHVNVKLVDYKADKAYKLAEELDKTLIINEDGRKTEIMLEEGLQNMDAFIAVTGRSETNILAAMLAKKLGVKKVIAEVENLNYIGLAENMGIDTIINKKLITASSIFRFTMTTDVQAIKCLNGCDAEILEFIVKADSPATKNRIKLLNLPAEAIIGGVVRGDKAFIAVGNTELRAYDRVVVFALPSAISKIGKFFD